MKARVDCIPCVFNQILRTAKASTLNENVIRKILFKVSMQIPKINLDITPPEIADSLYRIVEKVTRNSDPYERIKIEHINKALSLFPEMSNMVDNSKDPLKEAVKLSILGNSIDLGSTLDCVNVKKEFGNIRKSKFILRDLKVLKDRLGKVNSILFIGDNAGETVFDRPLVELLSKIVIKLIYAVKETPIINDATLNDAKRSGLECKIISTGSRIAGTLPEFCSDDFKKILFTSSLIIAKGQANYETLSNLDIPAFFLLKVKCLPISQDTEYPISTMLILKSKRFKWV
jgi:uncharacterized protein with ATP-grasp and redox domains